jgi:hypothetical protein
VLRSPLASVQVVKREVELVSDGDGLFGSASGNTDLENLSHDISREGIGVNLSGQRIITAWASAVRTIRTFPVRITLAALDLPCVPERVVVASVLTFVNSRNFKVITRDAESFVVILGTLVLDVFDEFVDVLARSMAGALVGTGGTAAALAFVTVEALALARLAVTGTFVGTLSVVVGIVIVGTDVDPSELEWAGPEGAVCTLPVLVACTLVKLTTLPMLRAGIGTHGGSRGNEANGK